MGYDDTKNNSADVRVSRTKKNDPKRPQKLASSARLMMEENSDLDSEDDDILGVQATSKKSPASLRFEDPPRTEGLEDVETPRKRGRGRPRKSESAKNDSTEVKDGDEDIIEVQPPHRSLRSSTRTEVPEIVETPRKRGRGRSRGGESPKKAHSGNAEDDIVEVLQPSESPSNGKKMEIPVIAETPRKRRGRSRKDESPSKALKVLDLEQEVSIDSSESPQNNKEEAQTKTPDIVETPRRRGRGRPRKDESPSKPSTVLDLEDEDTVDSSKSPQTNKDVTQTETLDSVETPRRRGRGRQRKCESPAKQDPKQDPKLEPENMVEVQSDSGKSSGSPENRNGAESEKPDSHEIPQKRGRGRPRRGEGPAKVVVTTPRRSGRRVEIEQKKAEEEKLNREKALERIQSRRKTRALRQKFEEELACEKRIRLAEQNAIRIEQGLEPLFDEDDIKSPKKRMLPRKPPSPKKKPRLNSDSPEKRKVGRPSKQDSVTKQVVSIFQMDDLEIFPNRSNSLSDKSRKPLESGDTEASKSMISRNKGESMTAPLISGVRRQAKALVEPEASAPIKFTPFPVPEVDEMGNLVDPQFIKTHLSDVAASFDQNARLTDEKAFFLEGSEGYFEQHSLRFRPSTNSLAANAPTLEYEEFIPITSLGRFIHLAEKEEVRKHQTSLFHQWCFELSQGYNLNIFGVGSKASFIMDFIDNYFLDWYEEFVQDDDTLPGVMVINGYNPATRLKTVLHDIVSLLVTDEDKNSPNFKMPKHVNGAFPFVISQLKKSITCSKKNGITTPKLILVIHNIDGEAFRDDKAQNFLSQLASLPNVWLISSTDTINVGLLWDQYRFKNFNFIWHEVTTYQPSAVEMSFKDVLSTGKSKKFVGSKGAKYVLASLTANAKNLYRVLSNMQLKKLDQATSSKATRAGLRPTAKLGLELKDVYDKCVQEYIASNEINFKTMLGEFVEHKMCSLVKNAAGVDIVFIPFTSEEIEKLLEDEL